MSEVNYHNGEMKEWSADRHRRLIRSIRREWDEAGYHRRQHLTELRHYGDPNLIRDWCEREDYACVNYPLSSWLAGQEIRELFNEITRLGKDAYGGPRYRMPTGTQWT